MKKSADVAKEIQQTVADMVAPVAVIARALEAQRLEIARAMAKVISAAKYIKADSRERLAKEMDKEFSA
jgi:hypothetical protein